ncbi:RDD family protein [Lysobacter antibioticus]|uniref:RDD family protein n=1 Tax=Lysobacter antibioticus TaxID=84531 RepID=A0A0S2F4R3_LYSAN|nr:RDD family protein [Lysobacter antibioticus]ALN78520.1 RDD family protein [Lysobacter antibioticus]
MSQWYYSDNERNRHGPLDGADMAARHRSGELGPDTLVWRDGLAQWRPWRELAHELVAEPGFAAEPERPQAQPGAAAASADRQADPAHATSVTAAAAATAPAAPVYDGSSATAESDSPYAAPRAGVADDTTVVYGFEVVHVGFWKRLAAYMIDSLLVGIAYYAVSMVLTVGLIGFGMSSASGLSSATWLENPGVAIAVLMGVVYTCIGLISAAYYVGFESSSMQATLGKLAVGIKVVDADGRRLTRMRALGRWASSLLSYLSLCVGFLMIAFTDRKRGLHDILAKTQVVDRWAYTGRPEMQRRDLGPVAIVVLVLGGLLWLLYVGVVLAMALLPMFGN